MDMIDVPGEPGHEHEDVEMIDAPFEREEIFIHDKVNPRVAENKPQTAPVDELKSFSMDPRDPAKMLNVGKGLSIEMKEKLKDFLGRKLEVFAWKHKDMVGH